MNNPGQRSIYLDSHVHFYRSWGIPLDRLLSSAYRNLADYSLADNKILAVCLLENPNKKNEIQNLLLSDAQNTTGKWKTSRLKQEPWCIWACNGDKKLLIIMGYQVNTAEGLEVLLIGNTTEVQHVQTLESVLEQHENKQDVLLVLPWAAGKWLGKRGVFVSTLLKAPNNGNPLLGDNAGRPRLWSNISQFKFAQQRNIPILAGSDPLPVREQYSKAGSFGNKIELPEFDAKKPLYSILQAINQSATIKRFGHLSTLTEFILNQFKLRF